MLQVSNGFLSARLAKEKEKKKDQNKIDNNQSSVQIKTAVKYLIQFSEVTINIYLLITSNLMFVNLNHNTLYYLIADTKIFHRLNERDFISVSIYFSKFTLLLI